MDNDELKARKGRAERLRAEIDSLKDSSKKPNDTEDNSEDGIEQPPSANRPETGSKPPITPDYRSLIDKKMRDE